MSIKVCFSGLICLPRLSIQCRTFIFFSFMPSAAPPRSPWDRIIWSEALASNHLEWMEGPFPLSLPLITSLMTTSLLHAAAWLTRVIYSGSPKAFITMRRLTKQTQTKPMLIFLLSALNYLLCVISAFRACDISNNLLAAASRGLVEFSPRRILLHY